MADWDSWDWRKIQALLVGDVTRDGYTHVNERGATDPQTLFGLAQKVADVGIGFNAVYTAVMQQRQSLIGNHTWEGDAATAFDGVLSSIRQMITQNQRLINGGRNWIERLNIAGAALNTAIEMVIQLNQEGATRTRERYIQLYNEWAATAVDDGNGGWDPPEPEKPWFTAGNGEVIYTSSKYPDIDNDLTNKARQIMNTLAAAYHSVDTELQQLKPITTMPPAPPPPTPDPKDPPNVPNPKDPNDPNGSKGNNLPNLPNGPNPPNLPEGGGNDQHSKPPPGANPPDISSLGGGGGGNDLHSKPPPGANPPDISSLGGGGGGGSANNLATHPGGGANPPDLTSLGGPGGPGSNLATHPGGGANPPDLTSLGGPGGLGSNLGLHPGGGANPPDLTSLGGPGGGGLDGNGAIHPGGGANPPVIGGLPLGLFPGGGRPGTSGGSGSTRPGGVNLPGLPGGSGSSRPGTPFLPDPSGHGGPGGLGSGGLGAGGLGSPSRLAAGPPIRSSFPFLGDPPAGAAGGVGGSGAFARGGLIDESLHTPVVNAKSGSGSGMPFLPPMGGGMGGAGKDEKKERERTTWLLEDRDIWAVAGDAPPGVIRGGSPDPSEDPTAADSEVPVYTPTRPTPGQTRTSHGQQSR